MGTIALQVPVVGNPNSVADPQIASDFTTLQTWANGNVDATNMTPAFAQSVSANQPSQTVKGFVSIPTSQSTGSTTYTTLSTPDQVTGLTLPSGGIIQLWYFAYWTESVAGAARAAIFLGANQLQSEASNSSAPSVTPAEAQLGNAARPVRPLTSTPSGLLSDNSGSSSSGPVTTGQTISVGAGGACSIMATPGTYAVSIRFKASSGTVTASNRQLWVSVQSFA